MKELKKFRITLISLYGYSSFGVRSIYYVLKSKNFDTNIVFFKGSIADDEMPIDKEFDLLVNNVVELKPDLIGLSFVSPYFVFAKKIIKMLRERINAKIIIGGTHATICPEECIKLSDFVGVGESEDAIVNLVNRLIKNKKTTNIANIWAKENGVVYKNDVAFLEENLDRFPIPDFSDLGGRYYIANKRLFEGDPLMKQNRYLAITSRGCPFQCSYCISSFLNNVLYKGKGKVIRKRSVDHVMRELKHVKDKIKAVNCVYFNDENFIVDEEWLDEFLLRYKKEIGFPFECQLHPNLVNEEIIRKMKEAGLRVVNVGIQSGSEKIRFNVYERPVRDKNLIHVVNLLKKYKVEGLYDIILDNPYENEKDLEDAAKLLLKIPRPYVLKLFSLVNFPKTKLTERLKKENFLKTKEEKALNQFKVTFDYKRKKFALYWYCILSLIPKRFIPKFLLRFIIKYKIFRKHPKMLITISNFANYIKLVQMGVKGLIHGNIRFRGVFKKFVDAVRRGHPI